MKQLIIRIANSRWLRIAAMTAALISGLDDLVELYFGVNDLFGMDVAHGMVLTALTGVLDPIAKLFERSEHRIEALGDGGKKDGAA